MSQLVVFAEVQGVQDLLGKTIDLVATHGPIWFWRMVGAVVVLAVGHWGGRLFVRVVEKMLERTRFDVTLRRFFCRALQSFLFAVVVLVVFDIFGVQTTSFIALLGAIGLALGLAVQGALSNFAAGVMLIILRPFKVEDAIEVGSIAGIVEEIGIFSARLRTADNRVIIVPNATFMAQPVTNATANPLRRVDLLIGVGYGDNLDTVKRIISGVLKKDTRVLETPVAAVLVDSLGESAVNIAVRSWVNTRDYAAVRADLLEKIKGALEAGGCTIPYPQCDVHLAGGASHATSPSVVP